MWFVRRAEGSTPSWTRTLVDVDFARDVPRDGSGEARLAQVNRCVKSDHIRVRERSAAEVARFLYEMSSPAQAGDST